MNTGVTFSLVMRQNKSFMEKIMVLILDEVIMLERHITDEQIYSFIYSYIHSVTDKSVADIHCDTTLINNDPLKIYVHPT